MLVHSSLYTHIHTLSISDLLFVIIITQMSLVTTVCTAVTENDDYTYDVAVAGLFFLLTFIFILFD